MRDYKNYRARRELEPVIMTRNCTYLIILVLLAVFSYMTERDSHPFNDKPVYQVEAR